MSIFISYSTKDKIFVDKLSLVLLSNNIPVWRDIWQIETGDYLYKTIQDAISKSYFICLVLSKNSLKSEWVQKEIEIALSKQSKENIKNLIIPVIIDDCELPEIFKDIKYIDFSKNGFDNGIKEIINKVAKKYNLLSGKFTNDEIATYFGTDIEIFDKKIKINFDVISEDKSVDYYVLTKFVFIGNDKVLEQFKLYEESNESSNFITEIIGVCANIPEIANSKLVIDNKDAGRLSFELGESHGLNLKIFITSKKVGIDNGKSLLFSIGSLLNFYLEMESKNGKS